MGDENNRPLPRSVTTWFVVIPLLATFFAGMHAFWPPGREGIDTTTVLLLLLAFAPWLLLVVKSFKLPGGTEVQTRELRDLSRAAGEAGLVGKTPSTGTGRRVPLWITVAPEDPTLAMAGLRIEIEGRVRTMAELMGLPFGQPSYMGLVENLSGVGTISGGQRAVLKDLHRVLSRAIHGAQVPPETVAWAISTGPQILDALDTRIREMHERPAVKQEPVAEKP